MQARVRAQTHQVWRDSFGERWSGDGKPASGRGIAPLDVTADTNRRAVLTVVSSILHDHRCCPRSWQWPTLVLNPNGTESIRLNRCRADSGLHSKPVLPNPPGCFIA